MLERKYGRRVRYVVASSSVLFACSSAREQLVEGKHAQVVYGDDDRVEVYRSDAALRAAARSVAAVIPRELLREGPGGSLWIDAPSLADVEGVCTDEAFGRQPSAAECTAFLIDDNLLLTAGHCFQHAWDCQNFVFVFGFAYGNEGAPQQLDPLQVYECRRTRVQENDLGGTERLRDYAVVELKQAVEDRTPFAVRTTPPESAEVLTVISATGGVPLKVDPGGRLLDGRTWAGDYFELSSDTFHGSSGAPVLDPSGAALGIVVRGNEDYLRDEDAGCFRVSHLASRAAPVSDGGAGDAGRTGHLNGEQANYVAPALESLCAALYPSPRLCGIAPRCGDRICSPGEVLCASDCPLEEDASVDAGVMIANDAAVGAPYQATGGGSLAMPDAALATGADMNRRPVDAGLPRLDDADEDGCRLSASRSASSAWTAMILALATTCSRRRRRGPPR